MNTFFLEVCLFVVWVSCVCELSVCSNLSSGWLREKKKIASQTNNWAAWLQSSWPIQARVPWLLIQTPPIFFIFLSAKTQALLRTQKTIYKTSPHFQLSSHCLCQCYEYNHFKFNFNLTICFRKLLWIIVITHCCHKPFFACRMYDSSQFQSNVCCYRILNLLVFVFACLYNLSLQAWIVISKEMHYRIW